MSNSFHIRSLVYLFILTGLLQEVAAQSYTFTYSVSSKGSDYYIYFSHDFAGERCDCDSKFSMTYRWSGGQVTVGGEKVDDVRHAVGANFDRSISTTSLITGKNNFIFNCAADCNAPGSSNGSVSVRTASIRAPGNVRAEEVGLNFIRLKWNQRTDFPANRHTYRIYQGSTDNLIDEIEFSDNFTVENLEPNRTYTFWVQTYNSTQNASQLIPVTVQTQSVQLQASDAELLGRTRLEWEDISSSVEEIQIWRDDELLETLNPEATTYTDSDGLPGFAYTYSLRVVRNGNLLTYDALTDPGSSRPNGRISGEVTAPFGGPVEGVIVCAERLDQVPQGDQQLVYCDTTDATGFYEIRNIYYHESARFRVVPTFNDHGFNPGNLERTLDINTPTYSNLNFVDTTSFTVQGRVIQTLNGDTCGVEGAEIWVNDQFRGTETDGEGFFSLTVDEIGEYVFEARYEDHSMEPGAIETFIEADQFDLFFVDTQTESIKGFVKAACDIYIGRASLRIWSTDASGVCIDTTLRTNEGSGFYQTRLPARAYETQLVDFEPQDPTVVSKEEFLTFFTQVDTLNLTLSSIERSYIYRRTPQIQLSGWEEIGCTPNNVPILEQGVSYPLTIAVSEVFGTDTCLVDTGFVVILDNISNDNPKPDTLTVQSGFAFYELIPNTPNIIAPYQKLIEVIANLDGLTAQTQHPVIVTGNRPREKTFLSVSPELPLMILRDPPGDASFSYLEEQSTTETAFRLFAQADGSIKTWKEVKTGTKFEAGIGPIATETEVWGTIGGSLEVGARTASQAEYILSITNSERFATSDSDQITGEEGDVFVGSALNLIYALTDVISYNATTCQIETSVDVIVGNDGFATNFIYTEDHVRSVLIPQLAQLRDLYTETQPDSAELYANQISVWQQTLSLNDELKELAQFVENRSFSAGAPYEAATTISQQSFGTIEFAMYLEKEVASEAGFEVAGSGLSGGVSARFRMEIGSSLTLSQLSSRKTGYVLNDDDPGDFFSVDVLEDLTYGTPTFQLVSGRSSCPSEAGTQPREGVQLIADSYIRTNVAPNAAADFKLNLGNTSQSDETQTYNLVFLQASNPDGALITLGGSPVQGGVPTPFTINPGSARDATITIARGPQAFAYEGLEFVLKSGCGDPAIADTASFSVFFDSPCSNVTLEQPQSGWIISQTQNQPLLINIRDYEINELTQILLQYAPTGTSEWQTFHTLNPADLRDSNTGTTYDWNTDRVDDGPIKLRAQIRCDNGVNYSQSIEGFVDRQAPQVFGIPEPADGIYEDTDVLAVTFDEALNCLEMQSEQILLTGLTSRQRYDIELGCSGNELLIIPASGQTLTSGSYEILLLPGSVADRYGNVLTDTLSWQFEVASDFVVSLVPEQDTDRDGYPNTSDNCPFAANPDQANIDGDAMGDLCDDDIDGDGVPNASDNCVYYANPDQADADGDGIGDVCESDADGDGDGISNETDNCPFTANADQIDQDQDGIGDVCDTDQDGDGVENPVDNCAIVANPDQGFVECETITPLLEGLLSRTRIQLYPNPMEDAGWIAVTTDQPIQLAVKLYTVQGQPVASWLTQRIASGSHRFAIKTNGLSAGLYMVRIELANEIQWTKVWIR